MFLIKINSNFACMEHILVLVSLAPLIRGSFQLDCVSNTFSHIKFRPFLLSFVKNKFLLLVLKLTSHCPPQKKLKSISCNVI